MPDVESQWLDAIYATSLKPSLWPDLLERVCGRVNAVAASINRIDPIVRKASLFYEFGTNPIYSASLLTTYAGMSPIGGAVLTAEVDEPLTAFDFIDEDEYLSSRFYKEWCQPQGYYDMLGAILMKSPTDVSAISTVRAKSAGRYGDVERAFVGDIAPHVRRAVTISGLLDSKELERELLVEVTDTLAAAVFILDGQGRTLRHNASADGMIANGEVNVRDGVVVLSDPDAQSALRQALGRSGGGQPSLFPLKSAAGAIYVAALISVRASGPFALLINLQAPTSPSIGAAIRRAYNLTPRELSVLLAIIQGNSIENAALSLGIEAPTARSHLHKIFVKTDTTRQGELIQKILAAFPPLLLKG